MRLSPALALLCAFVVLPLVACGNNFSYGCTGRTCTTSFEGPGEQDLSDALGSGATVSVVRIDGPSVTVRVAGDDAMLVEDKPRRVAGYEVTLTAVNGENVGLRIVGS